jgi:sialate O-acetylesterase
MKKDSLTDTPQTTSAIASSGRLERRRSVALFVSLLAAVISGHAEAEVKLPQIFGDHMVLQEGAKLPIWGAAAAGEKVTATIGSSTGSTVAAADGTWRIDLPAVPENTAPQVLTVAGTNTVTFQDVLVGDVWFASGQSNMDFGIGNDGHAAETIAAANEPQIRLFMVMKGLSLQPQTTMAPTVPPTNLEGVWRVCTPEVLSGKWGWNGYSALAYYFGREIHHHFNRPIGMIQSAWGGTQVAGWTSISGLEKNPIMAHYVADHQKRVDNFAQATIDYPKQRAAGAAAYKQWNDQYGIPFQKVMADWTSEVAKDVAAGKPSPPRPRIAVAKPAGISPPDGWIYGAGNLFNAMVNPVIPYGIKGVIWLQGEQDRGNAFEYFTSFPGLINDWREKWGEGNFPFLYVQLSNMNPPNPKRPIDDYTATLRDAQTKTLSVPNTGMANAIDIGSSLDIHYKDKLDAGQRLALVARRVAYGETVVAYGPTYDSMTVEGNKIRLTFKEIGSGLVLRTPPWVPLEDPTAVTADISGLQGFAIAGDDHRWQFAKAEIDGDSVVVSADNVPSPLAVRYDWQESPIGNLANKEGLPAGPFRTDDWDDAHPPVLPKPTAPTVAAQPSAPSAPAAQ